MHTNENLFKRNKEVVDKAINVSPKNCTPDPCLLQIYLEFSATSTNDFSSVKFPNLLMINEPKLKNTILELFEIGDISKRVFNSRFPTFLFPLFTEAYFKTFHSYTMLTFMYERFLTGLCFNVEGKRVWKWTIYLTYQRLRSK